MRILSYKDPIEAVIDNQQLENVSHFKYFDNIVTNNSSCTKEIQRRIEMANKAFNEKRLPLAGRLNTELKKKYV